MVVSEALVVLVVPQTVHFVGTVAVVVAAAPIADSMVAQAVRTADTAQLSLGLAVPTADLMVAQIVPIADIALPLLAAHGGRWDHTVDNS